MNAPKRILHSSASSLHGAALVLGVAAVASQALGLLRDRLFAQNLGVGRMLDIYYGAFRVPDLIYVVIASLFSSTVVIPFLAAAWHRDGTDGNCSSQELLQSLASALTLFVVVAAGIAFIAMPTLAPLVAPGFSSEDLASMVLLSRILLFSPLLLGLSSLFGAVTQSLGRTIVFAVGPILYNIGIIVGVLLFYPVIGITGLAWGVVLGAFLHAAVQIPAVFALGYTPRRARVNWHRVYGVLMSSLPRTLALSLTQLTFIVFVAIASLFSSGAVAVFQLSFNIQSVPLGIIGASYATAAFPAFSRLFAQGKRADAAGLVRKTLDHVLVWSMPVSAVFVVLREPIVRIILGNGNVGLEQTSGIALTMSLFAVSLVAQSTMLIFARAFFGAGDTRTPLAASALGALVSVMVGVFAYPLVPAAYGPAFLAASFSLGSIVAAVFARFFLGRCLPEIISRGMWRHGVIAATVAAFVAYVADILLSGAFDTDFFSSLVRVSVSGGSGILCALGVLYAIGNEEVRTIANRLFRRQKNVL